jgi:beta-phosphoglucomutase-like phosphatase (HAD superfamily)
MSSVQDMPNTKPHPDVYLPPPQRWAWTKRCAVIEDTRDRRDRRRRGRCDRVRFQRGRPAPQHAGSPARCGREGIFQRMDQLLALLAAYAADAAA